MQKMSVIILILEWLKLLRTLQSSGFSFKSGTDWNIKNWLVCNQNFSGVIQQTFFYFILALFIVVMLHRFCIRTHGAVGKSFKALSWAMFSAELVRNSREKINGYFWSLKKQSFLNVKYRLKTVYLVKKYWLLSAQSNRKIPRGALALRFFAQSVAQKFKRVLGGNNVILFWNYKWEKMSKNWTWAKDIFLNFNYHGL